MNTVLPTAADAAEQTGIVQNGIPDNLAEGFVYDGIPMQFFRGRSADVRRAADQFAPFFRIRDGAIVELDWQFYAGHDDREREAMHQVLLAAGILTYDPLMGLDVRDAADERYTWSPTLWGHKTYFSPGAIEHARGYVDALRSMRANEFQELVRLAGYFGGEPAPLRPVRLKIVQRTQNPEEVVIAAPIEV